MTMVEAAADDAVPDASMAGAAGGRVIRRRHVIYVEGYDPQGAKGYYRLFDRFWTRFLKIWPLTSRLGELAVEFAGLRALGRRSGRAELAGQ